MNDKTDRVPSGYTKIMITDLPEALLLQVDQFLVAFSTPLILDGKLAGSGTFIKCGNTHGILTAHHVVRRRFDFSAGSTQRLGLSLINRRPHTYQLPLKVLSCVDVGIPKNDEAGPDLSVIILPGPVTGAIEARKSFLDVSIKPRRRTADCKLPDGLWCAVGYPQNYERVSEPSGGGKRLTYLPMATLHANIVHRFTDGGFDFLELNISNLLVGRTTEMLGRVEPPPTFGGMSGGGIWRIPAGMGQDSTPAFDFKNALLAGVVFYETYDTQGRLKRMRGHGPGSIYGKVRQALLNWETATTRMPIKS